MRRRTMKKKVADSILKVTARADYGGAWGYYVIALDPPAPEETPQVSVETIYSWSDGNFSRTNIAKPNYTYKNGILLVKDSTTDWSDDVVMFAQTDYITITYKKQTVTITQNVFFNFLITTDNDNITITVTNADGSITKVTGHT